MKWELKVQCQHRFERLENLLLDAFQALNNRLIELLDGGVVFVVETISFYPFPDALNKVEVCPASDEGSVQKNPAARPRWLCLERTLAEDT